MGDGSCWLRNLIITNDCQRMSSYTCSSGVCICSVEAGIKGLKHKDTTFMGIKGLRHKEGRECKQSLPPT